MLDSEKQIIVMNELNILLTDLALQQRKKRNNLIIKCNHKGQQPLAEEKKLSLLILKVEFQRGKEGLDRSF